MLLSCVKKFPHIHLEDATAAVPWRCTGLRQLEMTINRVALPFHPSLDPEPNDDFFRNIADASYTDAPKSKLEQLKRFYHQIGSLAELTHIDLRAITVDNEGCPLTQGGSRFRRNSFLAMLNLSGMSNTVGPPEYLDCLEGLEKLRVLRRLVSVTTGEMKYTMGWQEAGYMGSHW